VKAFDRVNWNKLWNVMMERGFQQQLIRIVESLHHEIQIIDERGGAINGFILIH
jgi:hypothetical protein